MDGGFADLRDYLSMSIGVFSSDSGDDAIEIHRNPRPFPTKKRFTESRYFTPSNCRTLFPSM
jgi:hypothetical protein